MQPDDAQVDESLTKQGPRLRVLTFASMRRIRNDLLLAVLLLCESGCGTVCSFMEGTQQGERSLVYGGVRWDAMVVGHMFSGERVHGVNVFWLGLIFLFDLPFSAVADTVTLPIAVGIEFRGRPGEPSTEKSPGKTEQK
ncbi:MAG: hypothetical protein FD180_4192 [Planctomycetota bacterium]|nr:MAG: hypothetical protein FD180_4192 [Planctomycetota bacterium]